MSETEEQKAQAEKEAAEKKAAEETAAAQKNTEHLIPKSRFDEVNEARKKAEEALAAREKADKEAEEKRLADQNEYKALAEKREAELEALRSKSEAEKAQADEKAKKAEYEAGVVTAAAKLNFSDPQDAVRLLGYVDNTEEALKKLADEKPYLLNKKPAPRLNVRTGDSEVAETREERLKRLGLR